MKDIFENGWTSVAGVVAGVGSYLASAGLAIPSSAAEVKAFVVSLALVALGLKARDAGK